MRLIGILGGEFDPIHNGHINLALYACDRLGLEQVRLVPVNIPPHRDIPIASQNDRKAMLKLAIADKQQLVIDERELDKQEISYSINTLKSMRAELPTTSLCLLMGHDAFATIDSWYQWQNLIDYAHIIVASRDSGDNTPSAILEKFIKQRQTYRLSDIRNKLAGHIYFMEMPLLHISSTAIRTALANNMLDKTYLHAATLAYIKAHNLYQVEACTNLNK